VLGALTLGILFGIIVIAATLHANVAIAHGRWSGIVAVWSLGSRLSVDNVVSIGSWGSVAACWSWVGSIPSLRKLSPLSIANTILIRAGLSSSSRLGGIWVVRISGRVLRWCLVLGLLILFCDLLVMR
jgi:hypothetical protein